MLNFLTNLFQSNPKESPWRVNQCFSCGRGISKGMVFLEDRVSFCPQCFNTTSCFSCGLPCGPVHRRLSDDRIVCEPCYKSALITPRQLFPVYEDTIAFMRKKMKMKFKEEPHLKVVDTRFLKTHFNCSPYTWGVYVKKEDAEAIYIISGISLDKAHTTLAHELTHYWQKRNCPAKQNLVLVEGFAEWVAFQLAEYKQLRRAKLGIQRNLAEPYFTGFRKMRQMENKRGVHGVVKDVKTHNSF